MYSAEATLGQSFDFQSYSKIVTYSSVGAAPNSLYNDFLTSDGVNCKIDPWGNSIWLSMTFARNDRKYKSEGMVTIRNSNVLSMP